MSQRLYQLLLSVALLFFALLAPCSAQYFQSAPMDASYVYDAGTSIVYESSFGDQQAQSYWEPSSGSVVALDAYQSNVYPETYTVQAANYSDPFSGSEMIYADAAPLATSSEHGGLPVIVDPNYGYQGPGDMRTHLWNDHHSEMSDNGFTEAQVLSMSLDTAQKWHNYFHGTQGLPSERE